MLYIFKLKKIGKTIFFNALLPTLEIFQLVGISEKVAHQLWVGFSP